MAGPKVIRFDQRSHHLFVYDAGRARVMELDDDGNVVNQFGRRGKGPGEFQMVMNMFLTDNYIYIYDHWRYLIDKFDQKGNLILSMDLGALQGISGNGLSIPFSPARVENINNKPFVTRSGNLLLTPDQHRQKGQPVYEEIDWGGNKIAGVGDVPKGGTFTFDADNYQSAVSNHEIPALYKTQVFPVNDRAHLHEFFLVYSAIPKIEKFNAKGRKLWEVTIPHTPEIDSVSRKFYASSIKLEHGKRLRLIKYMRVVNNKKGELFLAANKNHYFSWMTNRPLWIHQYNPNGKLIWRYKLISKDVDLLPLFAIDFAGRRIFVVTEKAEIHAYPF